MNGIMRYTRPTAMPECRWQPGDRPNLTLSELKLLCEMQTVCYLSCCAEEPQALPPPLTLRVLREVSSRSLLIDSRRPINYSIGRTRKRESEMNVAITRSPFLNMFFSPIPGMYAYYKYEKGTVAEGILAIFHHGEGIVGKFLV